MIYEASNYMEGIEDHFQVNQLLFICPKNCRGGAFAPEILGGDTCPLCPPEYAPDY